MAKPVPEVRGSAVLGWDQESASPVTSQMTPVALAQEAHFENHQQNGNRAQSKSRKTQPRLESILSPDFYEHELLPNSWEWVFYLLRLEILTDAF